MSELEESAKMYFTPPSYEGQEKEIFVAMYTNYWECPRRRVPHETDFDWNTMYKLGSALHMGGYRERVEAEDSKGG